jgi:hypothetical protein
MAELNFRFVLAAYVLTWLTVGGYAMSTHRRLTRARRDFEQAASSPEAP